MKSNDVIMKLRDGSKWTDKDVKRKKLHVKEWRRGKVQLRFEHFSVLGFSHSWSLQGDLSTLWSLLA